MVRPVYHLNIINFYKPEIMNKLAKKIMKLIFGLILLANFSTPTLAEALRHSKIPTQSCSFIIEGQINKQRLEKFRADLISLRNPKSCMLDNYGVPAHSFFNLVTITNSPGGDLNAAFEIMKLIRKYKLNTHLDELLSETPNCLSSCSLIFASGIQRHYTNPYQLGSANNNVLLGIHKPYFTKGSYDYETEEKLLDKMKYEIMDFLSIGGIDPRFTIRMFEVQSKNIEFPSISDLLIWRVITSLNYPINYKAAGVIDNTSTDKLCIASEYFSSLKYAFQFKEHVKDNKPKSGYSVSKIKDAYNRILSCLNYTFID